MKNQPTSRSFQLNYELKLDDDGDLKPLNKKRFSDLALDAQPIEFIANHPYLFLIVDPTLDAHPILLMGRYAGWATGKATAAASSLTAQADDAKCRYCGK